jgi:putative tricarboxylic transport membrane protein
MDVLVLCAFALFGYLLRQANYPVLALVLGFILGGMIDAQFTRTLALYSGRFERLLNRPLFMILLGLNIIVFASPIARWLFKRIRHPRPGR